MNVAIVPRGVAHRDVGGVARLRREVHRAVVVGGSDEAELPVAGATGRRRRRAGRLGPARRLDGEQAAPAQVGAVVDRRTACRLVLDGRGRRPRRDGVGRAEQHDVGTVGEHDQRDDLPGLARARARPQERGRLGRPEVADRAARSPPTCRSPTPSFLARAATARAWVPAMATWSTWSATSSAYFSASSHAAMPEGHVAGLAEPLLPHLRAQVAGRAPPVEELLGGPAAADRVGEQRRVGLVGDEQGGGPVAEGGLVGPARQTAAEVGAHDEVVARARAWPRTARRRSSAPSRRRRRPRPARSRRSAAWMAVAFVLSA